METCLHFNVKSDSISRAKLALPSSHSLLSLLLPFLGNAKMKTFDSSIKSRKIERHCEMKRLYGDCNSDLRVHLCLGQKRWEIIL